MHRITRDHIVYSLSKEHLPVLEIDPGEVVVLETFDARTGTIRTEEDLMVVPHPKGPNPATGPIWVRGAEPGDGLIVEIVDIQLANKGFTGIRPTMGVLCHKVEGYTTKIVPIVDGMVVFSERIRFPVRPMVGVVGTAPAGEAVGTGLPGPHGGNMDHNDVAVGARVHLPVFVSGALFGVGDVHASMGDGEICVTGIEISAEVTVKVDLAKGEGIARPWIETSDHWISTGDADELQEAVRVACEEMGELLYRELELTIEETFMLISARGDVRISQACKPSGLPVTVRVVMPKVGEQPSEIRSGRASEEERLREELRQLTRRLEVVSDCSVRLHAELQPESVRRTIGDLLGDLFDTQTFYIFLHSDGEEHIYTETDEPLDREALSTVESKYAALIRRVMETQEPLFSEAGERGGVPLACVPLIYQKQAVGALIIESLLLEQREIERDDRALLSRIASEMAAALAVSHLYQKAESLASFDPFLTELYNRRLFDSILEIELKRIQRYGTTLSLVMLDIDDFKEINDTYGHPQGDRVLKKMSDVIKCAVRDTDIVARYGGEEIVIVLPNTPIEGGCIAAERIRRSVENLLFDTTQGTFQVTLSAGVVSYPADHCTKAELIERVDQALYRAKRAGKNQVHCYDNGRTLPTL